MIYGGPLLGDPAWPLLHPRPCTNTPWPELQYELSPDDARVLCATRLHFGPGVSTPPCKPGARLVDAASLHGLPHLKTLSLFSCFAASAGAAASASLEHVGRRRRVAGSPARRRKGKKKGNERSRII
nr:unnamed protein product [Digitaria exilis]